MNKMIVLHGLDSNTFSQAFRLEGLGVGSPVPNANDGLKYQIAFLMMSGYTADESVALLGYGVKKGLVAKHGVKWFLKVPQDDLKKVLNAVRKDRKELSGLGEIDGLGIFKRRWLPRRLRKLQIGKAIGNIARNVVAPVAKVTGAVLAATGIGAPIGAAISAGGALVGTLAKEGGPKASDLANGILGVAAAASGQGTLPPNVQSIVQNAVSANPEIARVANQINAVVNDPQVNAAVNEMRALLPQQSQSQLTEAVPPNFMQVSLPASPMETNMSTITTTDLRPIANRSSATPNQAGFLTNHVILIGGVALLGIGLILSRKK